MPQPVNIPRFKKIVFSDSIEKLDERVNDESELLSLKQILTETAVEGRVQTCTMKSTVDLQDKSFIIKHSELILNEKESIIVNLTDITAYKQLKM